MKRFYSRTIDRSGFGAQQRVRIFATVEGLPDWDQKRETAGRLMGYEWEEVSEDHAQQLKTVWKKHD